MCLILKFLLNYSELVCELLLIVEISLVLLIDLLHLMFSEAESWFIDSLEEWRKVKNLDDFILLGHSFGGYVATRYALKVCSMSSNELDLSKSL